VSTLLPYAFDFTATTIRPLLDNINVGELAEASRLLLATQGYAQRLLSRRYNAPVGFEFARRLTWDYTDHGFLIDAEEVERMRSEMQQQNLITSGVDPLVDTDAQVDQILDPIVSLMRGRIAIGTVKEIDSQNKQSKGDSREVSQATIVSTPVEAQPGIASRFAGDETGQSSPPLRLPLCAQTSPKKS